MDTLKQALIKALEKEKNKSIFKHSREQYDIAIHYLKTGHTNFPDGEIVNACINDFDQMCMLYEI